MLQGGGAQACSFSQVSVGLHVLWRGRGGREDWVPLFSPLLELRGQGAPCVS